MLLSARSSARKLPQSKAPAQGQKFFWALLNSRSLASLQPAGSKKLTPSLGSTAKTEASCVAGCRKPKNVFYGRHGERSCFRRRQSPEGWQNRGRRTLLLSAWLSARKVPGRSKNAGGERYCFRRARALSARSSARKLPQSKAPAQGQNFFWALLNSRSLASLQPAGSKKLTPSLGSTAKTEASCIAGCRKPKNVFYGRHGERFLSAQTIARRLAKPRAANTTAFGVVERPKGPWTLKERGRRTLLLSARSSARKLPQSKAPVQGQNSFLGLLHGHSLASLHSIARLDGQNRPLPPRPLASGGVSQRKFRTSQAYG